MLRKQAKKHFNSILIIALLLIVSSCSSYQGNKKDNCFILANGKKIHLFDKLSTIRETINVSRDIEYLDTLVFLYGFDDTMRKIDKYAVTPQILFYVDTTTKKTIKEEIQYNIERGKDEGEIQKGDLPKMLNIIKNQNVPFLEFPRNPTFDTSYTFNSYCHPYRIVISKINDVFGDKDTREVNITISISN